MWTLKRGRSFMPGVSIDRLKVVCVKEKRAKAKLRLLAAVRRKDGWSIDDIVDSLSIPRRTVHGWLTRLQSEGLKAVSDHKRPGRSSYLSKSKALSFRRDLLKGPPHDSAGLWLMKDVKLLLEDKYDVKYCRENVFKVIKRLGFSFQKPRPQHYKADKKKQESFKKRQEDYQHTTKIESGWSRALMNVR